MTTAPLHLPANRVCIIRAAVDGLYRVKGIHLSSTEYDALAHGIRAGIYTQVATDFRGQPVYQVEIHGQRMFVVWSPEFDCVRTFLGKKAVADHVTKARIAGLKDRFTTARAAFKPAEGGAS